MLSRLNTAVRYIAKGDKTGRKNDRLEDLTKDFRGLDNASFLAEVAKRLQVAAANDAFPAGTSLDPGGAAAIGLIGSYGVADFSIRQAEAVLRVDRTPSYWSHAFLITGGLSLDARINRSPKKSAWVWESTLEPATPFNHFVERNGVSARRIGDYSQARFRLEAPHCVPNIAVIAFALTAAERKRILDRADDPDVDQLAYDLPGLLGAWYSYVTDRAQAGNPLASGDGIYCSAYLQLAYDAAGIDLAPGAHERNTAPEHIWQGAKYLQGSFRVQDPATKEAVPRPVYGWYCTRDTDGVIAPFEYLEKHDYRRLSEITGAPGAMAAADGE